MIFQKTFISKNIVIKTVVLIGIYMKYMIHISSFMQRCQQQFVRNCKGTRRFDAQFEQIFNDELMLHATDIDGRKFESIHALVACYKTSKYNLIIDWILLDSILGQTKYQAKKTFSEQHFIMNTVQNNLAKPDKSFCDAISTRIEQMFNNSSGRILDKQEVRRTINAEFPTSNLVSPQKINDYIKNKIKKYVKLTAERKLQPRLTQNSIPT